ncbi:MAG: Gfo/Idh/MocA family oxidoreductase [Armatimonadota bacterium]|nr:Gfo/Idh/MocA family oxidoreductase [Armatimonadota bacterium]
MSSSPLRFAIVGCGSIAPTHADALAALPPGEAVLTACCDSVPERAQAFAERYGVQSVSYEALLRDASIDAVSVCAPSGLHAALGVPTLRAGKHVIVEKPMDVSLDACDRLMAAQRESGKTFAVISQHRFDPASLAVKEMMEKGEFGPLVLADARVPWYRTQEYYDSGDWRGTWAMDGGGCLMNQGVHTVDLLRWLCGPVATVYARAATLAHERIEVEDVVSATLTFANGAVGTLTASTAAYPGFAARLSVHGARGSAVIEGDRLQTLAIQGRAVETGQLATEHALQVAQGGTRAATASVTAASDPTSLWGDAHRAELQDFIECCRTGRMPLVNGQEGRNAVELVLAVYESARTGEVVRLIS